MISAEILACHLWFSGERLKKKKNQSKIKKKKKVQLYNLVRALSELYLFSYSNYEFTWCQFHKPSALFFITMPGEHQLFRMGIFFSSVYNMKISLTSEGKRYLQNVLETETTTQPHGNAVI